MRLVITAEHHFLRLPDGSCWGPDSMTYAFWERARAVFESVLVVARVRDVASVTDAYRRVDGPGVSVWGLPDYVGPKAFLKVRREFRRRATAALRPGDAVLLRVGCSPAAAAMETALRRDSHPYGVEVICDPHMVFAPGAIRHPLRAVFRRMFTRQLQRQSAHAVAATYVTESALQQRYPSGPAAFATHYSDVDLPPDAFVAGARTGDLLGEVPTVVSIGSMAQPYKGFDVLIEAVAQCVGRGRSLRLVLVGDGRHRPELEAQAARLGIASLVTFTGQLPGGAAVRTQLDQADLFVLASRTEGLPRVMIEAGARALPCLGTCIGGIPELLDDIALVPADDAAALAAGIERVLEDPKLRASQSARNLAIARTFRKDVLQDRRIAFLSELRQRTEAWYAESSPNRSRIWPGGLARRFVAAGRWLGR